MVVLCNLCAQCSLVSHPDSSLRGSTPQLCKLPDSPDLAPFWPLLAAHALPPRSAPENLPPGTTLQRRNHFSSGEKKRCPLLERASKYKKFGASRPPSAPARRPGMLPTCTPHAHIRVGNFYFVATSPGVFPWQSVPRISFPGGCVPQLSASPTGIHYF